MTTTSTKYRVHSNHVLPFTHQEGSVVDQVPPGYYKVGFNPMMGYFLIKQSDSVQLPPTIFGSANARCERIFRSYDETSAALGVGLFGKKGAGKSLLAAVIAQRTIDSGRPVIDVSDSFTTEQDYLGFLNSIQECTIIFDEFLKHISKLSDSDESMTTHDRRVVAADRQDEMLNFFQGTNNNKRLIILIDNNQHMLSEFLTDRPGRMRYKYVYEGVEQEVVEELCAHRKLTKEQTEQAIIYATRYRVSFDVINEILREWAKYPEETLEDITSILNVPSIYPEVKRKCRVSSFVYSGDDKVELVNEICEMSNSTIKIQARKPNPFLGTDYKTENKFYDSVHGDDCSYEYYKKVKNEPYFEFDVKFDYNHLVGMRGNKTSYSRGDFSIVVETLETETLYGSTAWNDVL